MGFIKAAFGAAGGQLADQWKEFIVCDSLDQEVLMAAGHQKQTGRSSNKVGEDNVITQGSVIVVADGQCAICVEQGAIVDFVAEPGEFTWDSEAQPSIFTGDLEQGIRASFEEMGKRFGFGGQPGVDQRVYFVNTKELMGNKYGTQAPIPFRLIDRNIGMDFDMTVRCNGEYSYRITNPLLFYKNVAGNAADCYKRENLDGQMRTELLSALQPAFGHLSEQGVRYSEIPLHTIELCDLLNAELSDKWEKIRGIRIVSFGINSITTSEENERVIKEFQKGAMMRDPNMAAGQLAAAKADALRAAASNTSGAMQGFMGIGMTNAATSDVTTLFEQGAAAQAQAAQAQQVQADAPAAGAAWVCSCGMQNTGNFCGNCGSKRPAPAAWVCSCGMQNTGNFCSNCGGARQ